MGIVTLRNGRDVQEELVRSTMLSLGSLLKTQAVAFCELVELCHDATHELWGNLTTEELKKARLITLHTLGSGKVVPVVHSVVRDIIVSAVEGTDLNMKLVSPIA